MSDITPPSSAHPPQTALRAEVIGKLSKLALLKASYAEIAAPHLTKIAAIQRALHEATAADVLEIDRLEEEIKGIAAENPDEVFGESRTIKLNNLSLGARRADKVEIEGKEDEVVSALEKLERSEDRAQSLYAGACLRRTTELNRSFIREQWGKEGADEYFSALGIKVRESTSVSISEIKPPKPKVTKLKGKDPAAAAATPSAES